MVAHRNTWEVRLAPFAHRQASVALAGSLPFHCWPVQLQLSKNGGNFSEPAH